MPGEIVTLGQLTPVRPDGFVMRDANGQTSYHAGLPWWLTDMRPQGFLGRVSALLADMPCCHWLLRMANVSKT